MKKIINIWNNNRILCLFILVSLTIITVFLSMILPMYSKSGDKYGNRLVGIEDVKIDSDIKKDIEKLYESNENIEKIKTTLKGKIYNVLITLKDNTDVNLVVTDLEKVIDVFTAEQLNYYDIQIFISSKIDSEEEENKTKTIVGYRNSQKEGFSWTNNR